MTRNLFFLLLGLLFLSSQKQKTAFSEGPFSRQSEIRIPNFAIETWGFFGHRRINRIAALTLPAEMAVFFKKNIEFLTENATAPDLRRYIDRHEAPRHFIDLDNYGPPFDSLPRSWSKALAQHSEFWFVDENDDTLRVFVAEMEERRGVRFDSILPIWELQNERAIRLNSLTINEFSRFFNQQLVPHFYDDEWKIEADTMQKWLDESGVVGPCVKKAFVVERLTKHGVLPWHLQKMQRDLTLAFREKNAARILRLAADFGHYLGDAHVPLHTSSNYDGQKTGQTGLHSFWESRLPELFADDEYDFLVGKPIYLTDPTAFFWETVFESHRLADSVFLVEKNLRTTWPADRQLCPDERNGQMLILPCREFAAEFQRRLGGMVERQMRAAIRATASAWYTAWVDGGQPDLSQLADSQLIAMEKAAADSLKKAAAGAEFLGRPE